MHFVYVFRSEFAGLGAWLRKVWLKAFYKVFHVLFYEDFRPLFPLIFEILVYVLGVDLFTYNSAALIQCFLHWFYNLFILNWFLHMCLWEAFKFPISLGSSWVPIPHEYWRCYINLPVVGRVCYRRWYQSRVFKFDLRIISKRFSKCFKSF